MKLIPALRRLWRHAAFRRLLTLRVLSQAADGTLQVGMASYLLFSPQSQPDAWAIAGVLALTLLPFSVIGPFVSPLLDRWSRRDVALYSDVTRAALSLVLGVTIFSVVSLVVIAMLGVWAEAMTTLSLIATAIVFCAVIGIPIGILCARSDRVWNVVRPILDIMQTTPTFVYLVPVVMLFGVGTVPGEVAVVYADDVGVGDGEVDVEVDEFAQALPRLGDLGDDASSAAEQVTARAQQDRAEERALAREVAVHRGPGDPDGRAEILQTDPVEAVRGEQAGGLTQQRTVALGLRAVARRRSVGETRCHFS